MAERGHGTNHQAPNDGVFGGGAGAGLQRPEPGALTTDVVTKLRSLVCTPQESMTRANGDLGAFWDGYKEAIDMAIRIVEDRHTISDCCNARCSSPIPPWHCFECEELDIEYGSDHIMEHLEEAARGSSG